MASDQRALPDPTAVALWRHGLQREEALLGSEVAAWYSDDGELLPITALEGYFHQLNYHVQGLSPPEVRGSL